jgi:4-hydroxy-2-oxoheptanedioate aldolase
MSAAADRLRRALGEGRARGVFLKLASADVVALVAQVADFLVVDLEHAQLSERDAARAVTHAAALGLPALVRVPAIDAGQVNRLLEAGAAGIQLSTTTSAEQVRALRDATRHPPGGRRSVSLTHPGAAYGATGLAEYLAAEDASPPLVVAQVETDLADARLDEIAAAGPDVIFVGTTDLLVNVGLSARDAARRTDAIAAAARRAGVVLGGYALEHPDSRYAIACSDLSLLRGALAAALS